MKFKLDENFGVRAQHLFKSKGYDLHTVRDENLQGCDDERLYKVCCAEGRCLVTLDLDFSDVIRFPPAATGGIAIIRLPRNPSLKLLEQLVGRFLHAVEEMSIEKHLWIIEANRIRIHQQADEDD